jgi:hypothetical protein
MRALVRVNSARALDVITVWARRSPSRGTVAADRNARYGDSRMPTMPQPHRNRWRLALVPFFVAAPLPGVVPWVPHPLGWGTDLPNPERERRAGAPPFLKSQISNLKSQRGVDFSMSSPKREGESAARLLDWLGDLKPLPKVHYSWPLPNELLDNPDDPRLIEYVRISHAACFSGEWATGRHVETAVRVCKRVNAGGPTLPASIAINYSPWHREFGKDLPPTDTGSTEKAELARFRDRITTIKQWLADANRGQDADIRVTALLLDSERLYVKPGDAAWNAAITAKYDLIHEIGKEFFPGARIEWYGRGVEESAHESGWSPFPWNTFENKAETFSCSLYRVPEIGVMRETFRRTYELARKHGVSEVTPWVALASGYRRQVDKFQEWDVDWDYDLVYSWMLGAELNQPWYGQRPERFAPWNAAKVVVFYPAPFNTKTPQWGKHFVAYVRGASGMKSLPDQDRPARTGG